MTFKATESLEDTFRNKAKTWRQWLADNPDHKMLCMARSEIRDQITWFENAAYALGSRKAKGKK